MPSPDGKLVATCDGDLVATMTVAKPDEFTIVSGSSHKIVYKTSFEKKINGFLWSPDSQAVAVLSSKVRTSKNPGDWLYALSGHPIQYEEYYLHIVDLQTLKASSFRLPITGNSSTADMLYWKQP